MMILIFCGPDSETLTSNSRETVGLCFNPKASGAFGLEPLTKAGCHPNIKKIITFFEKKYFIAPILLIIFFIYLHKFQKIPRKTIVFRHFLSEDLGESDSRLGLFFLENNKLEFT